MEIFEKLRNSYRQLFNKKDSLSHTAPGFPEDNYFMQADKELETELSSENIGTCHAGNNQKPEANAKTLKTSHIVYGVSGLAVFCGCLLMANAMAEPKETPKNNNSDLSLGSKVNNPAAGLPDSYKDIAKYNDLQSRTQKATKASDMGISKTQSMAPKAIATSASTTPTSTTAAHLVPVPPPAPVNPINTAEENRNRLKQKAYASPIAFNIKDFCVASVTNEEKQLSDSYGSFIESRPSGYPSSANESNTFTLGAGTVIPATMLTGVTSDVAGSDAVAVVRQDVYDSLTGSHILIPQGAKLIGTSGTQGLRGNKRLAIIFRRIILPDGRSLTLPEFQGIDGAGYPGLKDRYDQHSSTLLRTAFLASVFAAGVQSATGRSSGTDSRSPGEEAVAGSVASMLNTAQTIVNRDANLNPTITIRPGLNFSVFISRDLRLGEYSYVRP